MGKFIDTEGLERLDADFQRDAQASEPVGEVAFPLGAMVEKISGPEWRGKIVGHYSSTFTPNGIVIECIADGAKGQVHVEPAKRMRLVEPAPVDPDLLLARQIAGETLNRLGASAEQIAAGEIKDGKRDDAIIVHAVLAALRARLPAAVAAVEGEG